MLMETNRWELFVRPPGRSQWSIATEPRFQVIIDWIPSCDSSSKASEDAKSPRFRQLDRSLSEFLQLDADIRSEEHPVRSPSLQKIVERTKSQHRRHSESLELSSSVYNAEKLEALEDERIAFMLENYLRELLDNSDVRESSYALRMFCMPTATIAAIPQDDKDKANKSILYVDAITASLASSPDIESESRKLSTSDTAILKVAPGCMTTHSIDVPCKTIDAGMSNILLWRLESTATDVVFTTLSEGDEREDDPYQNSTPTAHTLENETLVYPTRYTFDEVHSAIGHSILKPHQQRITFQCENLNTQGIHSEDVKLTTQIIFIPYPIVNPIEWHDDMDTSQAAHLAVQAFQDAFRKTCSTWLEQWLEMSDRTCITEVVEDDTDDSIDLDPIEPSISDQPNVPTHSVPNDAIETEEYKHKAEEMEAKAASLQLELDQVKRELQDARTKLEISDEIYKANLETINSLQFDLKNTTPMSPPSSEDHTTKQEDPVGTSTDQVPYTEEERTRLLDLCASFQEQCLWKSIEVSESEGRNLQLTSELSDVQQEKDSLEAQVQEYKTKMEEVQATVDKLRAQKTVLVREVKRLQPYSQVNLASLVHDAQEARMLQRDLQRQLAAVKVSGTSSEQSAGESAQD